MEEAVRGKQIIAAVKGENVLGYLWSVKRNGVVKIRYLAVDPNYTGSGVGRRLVEALKSANRDAFSIRLSCRSDYPAWEFWKKIGFRVVRDRPGKAKSGSTLTDFAFELNPLPLLDTATTNQQVPRVAVDANVYFDILDPERPHHEESIALVADWLASEFTFCVTAALQEDLARGTNANNTRNAELGGWEVIDGTPAAVRSILDKIKDLIGEGASEQDRSDRKHLAHAISENVTAFVTRDTFLLDSADLLENKFGIAIKRPSEFIVSVDMLLNSWRYNRQDLLAIGLSISFLSNPDNVSDLAAFIVQGEKPKVLKARMREIISHPAEGQVVTIASTSQTLGLFATRWVQDSLDVSLLRCSNAINGRRISRTLASYMLSTIKKQTRKPSILRVSDRSAVINFPDELREAGFIVEPEVAYKVCLPGIWEPKTALDMLKEFARKGLFPDDGISWFQNQVQALNGADSFLRLEHAIFPGKIRSDNVVRTLVVPIKPRWARALFDPNLGQREFWDEDADLLLNPKSAYYTGARIPLSCGRIIWYVSNDERYAGSKATRACSLLTDCVGGQALDLYRRFRHFGIYELQDVEKIDSANGARINALEFTDTELFSRPISLSETRTMIGDGSQDFQWPIQISESHFLNLYQSGTEQC